jgi:hypothetical protein
MINGTPEPDGPDPTDGKDKNSFSQCWRLDARTLAILTQDPAWVDYVSRLSAGQPNDPLEAAHELLGRRLRHTDITWATRDEARLALCVNMGGGLPSHIIDVIIDASGFAQPS